MLFISIGGIFLFLMFVSVKLLLWKKKNLNVYYCLVIVISFKYFRCFLL